MTTKFQQSEEEETHENVDQDVYYLDDEDLEILEEIERYLESEEDA